MSALRVLRPHLLRPQLSQRYQHLRRANSTTPTAATISPPPPNHPTFLRRNRATLLWTTLSLALGLMAGNTTLHIISPPPMPEPGTHEDRILIADLNKRIDQEFLVKVLRGKCLGVAKQLKGSSEARWVEVIPPIDEEGRWNGDELVSHMQGAKGLGVERVFWDRDDQKLVAIIWFGGALSGWPGVTHGGAIATVLAEKGALAAALVEGRRDRPSTAAATPQRLPGTGSHAKIFAPAERHEDPAQLSLSYVKPTQANNFYVIRVSPSMDLDQDPEHIVPSEPRGGHEYEATLETIDSRVCVKAKVKFAPSSTLRRVEDEVVQTAKASYAEFKHWLWPSRQQQVASHIA
ncbi:hypothetical protein B0A55_01982 [Friedmanniomyces simplex]|uniref:Thioesterase domain-containing protein n=1 Tax=Friedmanniomyces simplex TaxID=329884 RepID=A0A4U0XSB2_9PEZI|nr:hypothetical protein B0A55_01982 [Friedmanniomyces simplex]